MEKPDSDPQPGFILESRPSGLNLTGQQKVALLRRGNELFNQGKIEESKRIFITLGYTDGLIRVGNYYYGKKRFIDALRMFASAPDLGRIQAMAPSIARVIRVWLESGESADPQERT